MRWHLVATVLAIAVVLAVLGASAPAEAHCAVARGKVIKESRYSVILKQRVRGQSVKSRYYGCLRSTGRPIVIGRDIEPPEDEVFYVDEYWFRLRGRFASVAPYACLGECATPSLEVFDLRAGRRVRRIQPYSNCCGASTLRRVFLTARGALAYVAYDRSRSHLVAKADAAGYERVARGEPRDLPVASVFLSGNRLYWRLHGERRSVRLRSAR